MISQLIWKEHSDIFNFVSNETPKSLYSSKDWSYKVDPSLNLVEN